MPYEQRDNSGALFRNDRKTEPNHADYNGSVMIGGQEYYINAWLKDGKNGKFFSLSFNVKNAKPVQQKRPVRNEFDDDIPY